ncbi:hypothetical protein ACQEVS_03605 [Streptomyces sp. CA-181903]
MRSPVRVLCQMVPGGSRGFGRLVWREAGTERTDDHVTLTLALCAA